MSRTKDEGRNYKGQRTKYKLRSTVAALLFASSRGAYISHTCPTPLSYWRGAGGEAPCSSAMCKVNSRNSFQQLRSLPNTHAFNRGTQKTIDISFPPDEAVGCGGALDLRLITEATYRESFRSIKLNLRGVAMTINSRFNYHSRR